MLKIKCGGVGKQRHTRAPSWRSHHPGGHCPSLAAVSGWCCGGTDTLLAPHVLRMAQGGAHVRNTVSAFIVEPLDDACAMMAHALEGRSGEGAEMRGR